MISVFLLLLSLFPPLENAGELHFIIAYSFYNNLPEAHTRSSPYTWSSSADQIVVVTHYYKKKLHLSSSASLVKQIRWRTFTTTSGTATLPPRTAASAAAHEDSLHEPTVAAASHRARAWPRRPRTRPGAAGSRPSLAAFRSSMDAPRHGDSSRPALLFSAAAGESETSSGRIGCGPGLPCVRSALRGLQGLVNGKYSSFKGLSANLVIQMNSYMHGGSTHHKSIGFYAKHRSRSGPPLLGPACRSRARQGRVGRIRPASIFLFISGFVKFD